MVEQISTKLSEVNRNFLKKLVSNLRKAERLDEMMGYSYSDALELIVNYFKMNNDLYVEMIQNMEVQK